MVIFVLSRGERGRSAMRVIEEQNERKAIGENEYF